MRRQVHDADLIIATVLILIIGLMWGKGIIMFLDGILNYP